jgi:hypothetical protein
MAAIANTMISNMLNASLPTGTTGEPTTWTPLSTSGGMKIRLTSAASTASAAGATLTGGGYADYVMTTSSTASASGSNVTLPAVSGGTSWNNSSGGWTIYSIEVQDNANTRAWFGNFNGAPITIAALNTFAIAQNAVTVSLS